MKKAKKIVALLLCAVLLVGATVAGTLAYLTDSKSVENTFTVGKVAIELYEKGGNHPDEGKTEGLALHLVPNVPVQKEPYVTVLKDSEDCYVRAKVTVTVPNWTETAQFEQFAQSFATNYLLNDNTVTGFNTTNWNVSGPSFDATQKTITYMLTYKSGVNNTVEKNTTDNTVLEPIFNDVIAPSSLTNAQLALLAGMTIKVEAHAIQAEGFIAAEDKTAEQNAWAAFDSQNT